MRRSIQALHVDVSRQSQTWTRRRIVTFHGSLFYFAARYGLQVAGVVQPVPGSEPSARHIEALARGAARRRARGALQRAAARVPARGDARARGGGRAPPDRPDRRRPRRRELRAADPRHRARDGRGAAVSLALARPRRRGRARRPARARRRELRGRARRVRRPVRAERRRQDDVPARGARSRPAREAARSRCWARAPGRHGAGRLPAADEVVQRLVPGARGGRDRRRPHAAPGRSA